MKNDMTVLRPICVPWSKQQLRSYSQRRGRGGSTSNPITFLHSLHGITPALGGARAPVCSYCSSLRLSVLCASAVTTGCHIIYRRAAEPQRTQGRREKL